MIDGCNIVNNYTQLYGNYIDVYVDGTLNRSISLGSNTTFNLSQAPLNYENCCGYFTDEAITNAIEDGENLAPVVQSAIATGIPGQLFNIYTKQATLNKLQFNLNDGNESYYVKQVTSQ